MKHISALKNSGQERIKSLTSGQGSTWTLAENTPGVLTQNSMGEKPMIVPEHTRKAAMATPELASEGKYRR